MKLLLWFLWVGGGHLAAAITCVWAFRKGGRCERIGAVLIGCAWTLTQIVSLSFTGPGQWVFWIDFITGSALLYMALAYRRAWTFFATAVMLNTLVGHLVNDITSYTVSTYATANALWSGWALLICLASGVYGYQKHIKQSARVRPHPQPVL